MSIKLYKWLIIGVVWFFPSKANAQEIIIPDSVTPYKLQLIRAEKLIDSAKYKDALVILKKLVKEKPDYVDALNKMALAKIRLEKYKEAAIDLEKSELLLMDNYETKKLKGINFYLNNKFAESKAAIDTALSISREEKLDPDAELFYYQALLMYKGKSYKTALAACDAALDANYRYQAALALKGKIRLDMKAYPYAVKELSEAIELAPPEKPDYQSYKLRAKSRFELKDYKGAVGDWSVYLEAFPKEEEALIARAAAKINMNDNSSAIDDLDQALKINSKNPITYNYRGIAKAGNGKYKEGLEDLNYSLKLKFDYAGAYVNRAAIKMELKDKRGACQDLEKADRLGDTMAYKLIERYCKH